MQIIASSANTHVPPSSSSSLSAFFLKFLDFFGAELMILWLGAPKKGQEGEKKRKEERRKGAEEKRREKIAQLPWELWQPNWMQEFA